MANLLTVEDPDFGPLTLDDEYFSGEREWPGGEEPVRLVFDAPSEPELGPLLDIARALWADIPHWDGQIREILKQGAYEQYRGYLEEEPHKLPDLTKAEFAARFGLAELAVAPDGTFEMYLEEPNGDLLGDHAVVAIGSLDSGTLDGEGMG